MQRIVWTLYCRGSHSEDQRCLTSVVTEMALGMTILSSPGMWGRRFSCFLKNPMNIYWQFISHLKKLMGGDDSSKKPVGKSCQGIIMLVQTKADAPQLYRSCWQNSDNCYFLGPSKIVTHTSLDNFSKRL